MLTYHFLEHAKLLNWLINDEIHICHGTIPIIKNVVCIQSLVQAFFYYMPCIWFSWFAHVGIVPPLQLLNGPYNEIVHLSQLFCGN